jgi:hypothetical protein
VKVNHLKRLPAMEAAKQIINRLFPNCEGALLAEKMNDKNKVIDIVQDILDPHGGNFFEGFSLGKKQ